MIVPLLASSGFVLAVVVLCFVKPNAGRIFLGLFFLAMALGVNGTFTFGNPRAYLDYAQGALIPAYAHLATWIVSLSPVAFGLLVMAFEVTMGLLLLHRRRSVKVGLIGTMIFLVGIAPLSWLQLPWLGLIVAEGHLLRREFDRSLVDMFSRKFSQEVAHASR